MGPADGSGGGRRAWPAVGLLAALAYVPALLTARGQVPADTKHYLYLDPGRLLRGAPHLWDPGLYGGWVTHQTIGYLWPMGPFYWLLDTLGLPDWTAQRLWIGTLLLAAGAGMLFCARVLRLSPAGALLAALVYQLSPYLLGYINRTSVLLTPWAGLGWMLGLAILAARRGGWRYPAVAALVIATIGGINATALVLCGLAPVLWLLHASFVSREVAPRRALGAGARVGLLALGANLWWIVALAIQNRYGAAVLTYSETVEAVSTTSLGGEVLRSLGYWLFYGGDVVGRWNSASTPYLQNPGLIALGFVLVALAMLSLVLLRWRDRTFLVALVLVGTVVAVGAHLYADPSPLGSIVKGASADSTLVLALRSSTRAIPLVLLAFALALGAAITAVGVRRPRAAVLGAAAVAALCVANLPALWNGTLVDRLLRRPEQIPAWWVQAADQLGARTDGTRILELPGQEFAAYRWGQTTDPLLPGLTDRPVVTRDLLPLGGAAEMDLVNALDQRFQDGTEELAAVAPVARLLGAGDVVLRGDVWFERFRTPRPERSWAEYQLGAPGLGVPKTLGPSTPNLSSVPTLDEDALGDPTVGTSVPVVAIVPVLDAQAVVRTRDAAAKVVVAGSGDGLVDAAAAGVIDGLDTVVYSASHPSTDELRAAAAGARLVVTDANRKRATQWRGTQDTTGFTEDADTGALDRDTGDARLPVFPGAGPASQTLAQQRGAVAQSSAYGGPSGYRPEDRAAMALDGEVDTAWRLGDRAEAIGERLRIDLPSPTTGPVTVVQDQRPSNRWITEVELRTEGGAARVALTEDSRRPEGQVIPLPAGETSWVEIAITGTSRGPLVDYLGVDAVGLAEVRLPGITSEEVVRVPTDLLDGVGPASLLAPLDVVLTRQRMDAAKRWRDDPERRLVRAVELPTDRTFAVSTTARLSPRAADGVLASLLDPLGRPATASARLAGYPNTWGRSALDGDPATAWTTAFGPSTGATLSVTLGAAQSLSGLNLQVLADGRHSVPTSLRIDAGGETREVPVPSIADGPLGTVASVPLSFAPLSGDHVTVTVTSTRDVGTIDRRSGEWVLLPVAIAELGLPRPLPPLPATFDTGCRTDLLTVDGRPVPLKLSGSTADALAGRPLTVTPCDAGLLSLGAGEHLLRSAAGVTTGIDIDRVVLRSDAGGGPLSAATSLSGRVSPLVTTTPGGRTTVKATVSGATAPFWLILGQSHSPGWHAVVDGHDLGPAQVVDGGVNGWLVDPGSAGGVLNVRFEWRPQRFVWAGLAASALAVFVCLGLVVLGRRRRSDVTRIPLVSPALASPLSGSGGPTGWFAAVVVGVVAGAIGALAILPPYGAVVGVIAAVSARWPRARFLLTLGAVGCVVLTGAMYVVRQVVTEPQEGFGWVTRFEFTHRVALLAVVLLAADAVVEAVRGRSVGVQTDR
jgi:arabinofuranan 3-O-arabinosyltransferase